MNIESVNENNTDLNQADELRNQQSRVKGFKIVSWTILGLFCFIAAQEMIVPFITNIDTEELALRIARDNYEGSNFTLIFITMMFIVAFLESCFTIGLYYFAIYKPYKKGNYDPTIKPGRYIIISVINYFLITSICIYGLPIFFLSGLIWPHIVLCLMGILLFIYHRPKYNLFMKKNITKEHELSNKQISTPPPLN